MNMPHYLSPGLIASQGGRAPGELPAVELKYLVSPEVAERLAEWAKARLVPDPYADPATGGYRVTTVYLDTPGLDIFRRNPGFGTSKYRLRRYGKSPLAHAEHKFKGEGQIWKQREGVQQPVEEWTGDLPSGLPRWFLQAVERANLRPVCAVTYDRLAYLGDSPHGPVRITLDRDAFGRSATGCELEPVRGDPGRGEVDLLGASAIVELKHLGPLPRMVREVVTGFGLVNRGPSKYRRTVAALGLGDGLNNS